MKKFIFIFLINSFLFSNIANSQIIVNENFEGATCTGNSAFNNGCVPGWQANDGSPSINANNTNYAWMWSYGGNGEAISTNANFIAGRTYSVRFSLSTDLLNNNIANNAMQNGQVFIVATNNAGVVTNNPNGDVIWNNTIGGNYFQNSQNITVCFTATQNTTQLWIYPFWNNPNGNQNNQVEMSIDNIIINDTSINFHFEHQDGTEDDTFSICEDVFLDGSQIVNPNGNFFMDIRRVNANGSLSWLSAQGSNPNWPGWVNGQPTLVNVTQVFVNDLENPVTFQAGVTYEVKLAINDPICGWTEQTRRFTYVESDISSDFTIDYHCYDGVYDATVTATNPGFPTNHWWRLYETSVEGSVLDADTIGTASSPAGDISTVFEEIDPTRFYYVIHRVSTANCPTQETRIALDRDCCIDDPVIIPYCEDPCVLDSFPLKVKDNDGNIITVLDGATFSWNNATTGATSNSDVVTASEFDHWFLTLTMPDGCIYNLEYKLICCDDDIQLEAYDCPTREDIVALEAQLQSGKSTLDKKTYDKYSNYLNTFKGERSAKDCDPCESGLFIIRVVDGNGDLVTNFISITWSDGLYANENIRWGEVNTTYSVTVVVPASNGVDTCTYTDEIIYECEDKCANIPAPTNLQNNGSTLSWDPVPGVDSYIISSPSNNEPQIQCCNEGSSSISTVTNNTFISLSTSQQSRCFIWQVTAVCSDGSLSPVSAQSCHLPSLIQQDDVKNKVSIYPNPNNGNMDIKVELEDDSDVHLNVYRFDGILVKTIKDVKTENTILSLNLQLNLPSGLYFFNFKTNKGLITKRVIIE